MADVKALTLTIFGVDKASESFLGVEKSATSMGDKVGALGKILAGAAVVGFFKDSVEAAAEAEQSSAKLQDAFAKYPKLADSSAESIGNLSSALALKTKYDDDATNSAAATLAQFDLTGKQIEGMLPLLQDYASKTGKDLPTAATDMGKALLGQTRALKDIGIDYKSTGDKATDFTNITRLMAEKVGGFAEVEGQTAAGKLEILKNKFGEVQESVGGLLIPVLDQLMDVLGPVIQAAGSAVTWFGELPGPVKIAAVALVGLALAGPKIAAAFRMIKQEMAFASYGMGSFAGGAAKLGKMAATGGALVGVGLVISAITSSFQRSAQQMAEVTNQTDSLTTALVENGGAWSETIRKQQVAAVAGSDAFKSLVKAGVSYQTAMDFMTGSGASAEESLRKFNEELERAPGASDALADGSVGVAIAMSKSSKEAEAAAKDQLAYNQSQEAATKPTTGHIAALGVLGTTLGVVAAATKVSEQATKDAAAAEADAKARTEARTAVTEMMAKWQQENADTTQRLSDELQTAKDKLTPFAAQTQTAADKQQALAGQAQRVNDELDRQNGILPDVDGAIADVNASLDDMADAFGIGTDKVITAKDALNEASGKMDLTTDAGRKLYEQTTKVRDGAVRMASAQYGQTLATKGQAAADKELRTTTENVRKEFIQNLTKIPGMTEKMATQIADDYGLIPKDVETAIKADNAQAKAKAAEVEKKQKELDKSKSTVNVDADSDPALRKMRDLKGMTIPDKNIKIGADISLVYRAIQRANNAIVRAGGTVARSSISVAMASGGAVTGNTPKGIDAQHRVLAVGEHVLSDADVDAMGGQAGVYSFRKALHSRGYATAGGGRGSASVGGGVNVNVYVSGTVVANQDQLARTMRDAVVGARRRGAIPAGAF